MLGSDRRSEFVTTELLSAWTDPDTAMEAVGASLGIFGDRVPDVRRALATETPLRKALYQVLLDLVEGGALEKRALTDGRYAFRWRDNIEAPVLSIVPNPVVAEAPSPAAVLTPTPPVVSTTERALEVVPPAVVPDEAPATNVPRWSRVVGPAAPLVLPAVSCVIAILAFVWLDAALAFVIAAALMLVGVVGLLRRVPFAGLWIAGVFVAGVLLRFS